MERRFFLRQALALSCVPALRAQGAGRRRLANAKEVHAEISLRPGAEAIAGEYFPSFFEYQEMMLYHPAFGYYSSGRVSFTADYQTFPNTLAPFFGQMVAEQIIRMWEGMKRAGTLGPGEQFTILEYGAGNGALAESIMDYLDRQSRGDSMLYMCCDRAPAMSDQQRRRNARFGNRFQAVAGDATDPAATVAPGSLKGVILSNELADNFGVHKVLLSPDGSVECAYVVPSLAPSVWDRIRKKVPGRIEELIGRDDNAIRSRLIGANSGTAVYLSRVALIELLKSMASDVAQLSAIQFREAYVPARTVAEVAAHFSKYAQYYAHEMAKRDSGVVAYISPGAEKFIQGAARILKTGYVMTIDYGANWPGILSTGSRPHLRTYGQGSRQQNAGRPPAWNDLAVDSSLGHMADGGSGLPSSGIATMGDSNPTDSAQADPYRGPTLNDITADVNFGLMDAAGQAAGLRTVYFGPQRALQSGTPVALNAPPADVALNDPRRKNFNYWVKEFLTNNTFKILVQQKDGADPSYSYPDRHAEALGMTENDLKPAQRSRRAGIENRLREML
jgi:SAM-dependent MidA family methyltransferase